MPKRVGKGTGFRSGLGAPLFELDYVPNKRAVSLLPRAALVIEGYPACAANKYGSLTLGNTAAVRTVELQEAADGPAIRKYPHHVLVTCSAALATNKTVVITGRDYYGRPQYSEFVLGAGGAGWYSPGDFSWIQSITVTDNGGDNGKVLSFGDAVPGQLAACPMFSSPLPITANSFSNQFQRASPEVEWVLVGGAASEVLSRDRPNQIKRGAFRFSTTGTNEGPPDGRRGYMVLYSPVFIRGDQL